MSEKQIQVSVVVPFYNERDNIAPLIDEIRDVLAARQPFEIIAVDDGSSDDSLQQLKTLQARIANLRVIAHRRNAGQSAALVTGVGAATSDIIATLDGDGQNPPTAIATLLDAYGAEAPTVTLVVGRRHQRHDSRLRLLSSRIANAVRQKILADNCDDTGCGLKVFSRAMFLTLPQFNHMHRFLPALAARAGATVVNVDVAHRERRHGVSKYGIGNRLWVGIVDLLGVLWLQRRALPRKDESREHR